MADPPQEISIYWCPVCGRDDRVTALAGRCHYDRGKKCLGTPERVTYVPLARLDALRQTPPNEAA